MTLDLPKSLEVAGEEWEIRSDFRAIIDICIASSDVDLSDTERALTALTIFYPDFEKMPQEAWQEALERCFEFIAAGQEDDGKPSPKIMDWEQDMKYIVPALNNAMKQEIRSLPYMHWWTFVGAFMELGDCTFAQICRIRIKRMRHEKLDKAEQRWYRENKAIVDIKTRYSEREQEMLAAFGVK